MLIKYINSIIMLRVLFLVLSMFVFINMEAQTLQVRVVDPEGVTLPYAGVYINYNQCSVTDSDGLADIPLKMLNEGDTITSTYIGMKSCSIILNKAILSLSKCTIVLNYNQVYGLDPVVVKAIGNDDWKFFKKTLNTPNSLFFKSFVVRGRFNANFGLASDSIPRNIEGSFVFNNIIPPKTPDSDIHKYYFAQMPEITCKEVDTIIKNQIIYAIDQSLNLSIQVISRIHLEHLYDSKTSKVTYLGVYNNCHFFRIVYAINIKNPHSVSNQILLSVNKDTKEIASAEFYPALKIFGGSLESRLMTATIYKRQVFKKGRREDALTIPIRIEYSDKFKDNSMIHLIQTDVVLEAVN